jgi:hypothetical protein
MMREMRANSGTMGVYRHGSAWVAQYVDADGVKRQRRFADKWSAAQWREAAIEGREPAARATLAALFSAEEIDRACTARGLTGRRAAALHGGARWLRSQCRDLLDVDPRDTAAVRTALEAVLNRRKLAAPDPRKVAQRWRLVGRWELRGDALWRDGAPITIRATAPRPIRLAVEPSAALVPPARGRRVAILQRVLAMIAAQHPEPVPQAALTQSLGSVRVLEALGLVERAPAPSPARTALVRLLARPCTQSELGQQATASLRARGFIEPVPLADTRLRASAEQVALTRAVLGLVCAEVPTVKLERAPQRLTRLAIATGDGDPHADAAGLRRFDEILEAHADGDALDRILWLAETFALRQSEARGLRVGDLDLSLGHLYIRRNRLDDEQARPLKTRQSERHYELPAHAVERLTAWTSGRAASEWLVPGIVKTRALNTRRNERAREAGFTGRLYASDHRHIRATQALLRGATLTEAAQMLGHKNTVQVSKTYGELTKGVVRASLLHG